MSQETQAINDLTQRLHDSPTMAAIAIAGAGNAAVAWLLGVPGASRTALEVRVPYASSALTEFVGYEPTQFVSRETAAAMARAAYRRAVALRGGGCAPVVGAACTATIATDRAKRGEHRCFVAVWSADGVANYDLTFVKGLRDRAGEDSAASLLLMRALADAAGLSDHGIDIPLDPQERVNADAARYADAIDALAAAHIDSVIVRADGAMAADAPFVGGVLSGSFNPLHEGHEALARAAARIISADVVYELSIANVDKPPLTPDEARRRVKQFRGKASVALTREPVFADKARLLPGCAFIIGVDTAARLIDPRYYGGSRLAMLTALDGMRGRGCRFLVAGRVLDGAFRSLDDMSIPDGLADMFAAIPESEFRADVSSSAIRQASGAGAPVVTGAPVVP